MIVPVKRVPIYELRERIYHTSPKVANFPSPPAVTYSSFTVFEKDKRDGLFPVTRVFHNEWNQMNVEVVDEGSRVKLRQYFPMWQHVRDDYTVGFSH